MGWSGRGRSSAGPGDGAVIRRFLDSQGWARAARDVLAGDASARRYWRLEDEERGTALLMDASVTSDLGPFLHVAGLLREAGLAVPEILAAEPEAGLALVEDFGDAVFATLLAQGEPAEPLFDLAVDVLIHLHRRFDAAKAKLPAYDAELFLGQLDLFLDEVAGPPETARRAFAGHWRALLVPALAVPHSLLHRDYHAGNLILRSGRKGIAACGLLDFQDAGIGPIGYDIASLVEDARRDVPEALRRRAVRRYLAAFPDLDSPAIERSIAILALMRHLRVIGIFTRLARRDGKRDYLIHLPRLWRLVEGHLARPECAPLRAWFDVNSPTPRYSVPL